MVHIFISYSHSNKDRAYARKLADYLLEHGFDVWIDDRIDLGSNWEDSIFSAIDQCGAYIIIMSPQSAQSKWVQRERLQADARGKQTFPFLFDGEVFPFYRPIQYYDVRDEKLPTDEFLERIEKFVPPSNTTGQNVAVAPQQEAVDAMPSHQAGFSQMNSSPVSPGVNLNIPVASLQSFRQRLFTRMGEPSFIVASLIVIVITAFPVLAGAALIVSLSLIGLGIITEVVLLVSKPPSVPLRKRFFTWESLFVIVFTTIVFLFVPAPFPWWQAWFWLVGGLFTEMLLIFARRIE